jgi:threonine dehydratase
VSAPTVTYEDVAAAAARLEGVAHRTPVATSEQFDALTGTQSFFKCENLQRMGAFKFRGAYNALSQLEGEAGSAASSRSRRATTPRRWRSPADSSASPR